MTEAQKLQDNLGATKTVKLKYPVRLATGETLTDPNNPLPTPAIISGKQNPLLSLLPESVQAQASEVIKAVETGVKIYRAAESG
ncbi:TPA: phage tail protein, partial [Neisseria subflava]